MTLRAHRNIANLVVNTDINCQSVIRYAVELLHVKYIVVCGHYGCGGVQAAMQSSDLGLLNGWLREVRDVYRLHSAELDSLADSEQRHRRLVELSVKERYRNVIKTPWVHRHYLEHGYPTVHGPLGLRSLQGVPDRSRHSVCRDADRSSRVVPAGSLSARP